MAPGAPPSQSPDASSACPAHGLISPHRRADPEGPWSHIHNTSFSSQFTNGVEQLFIEAAFHQIPIWVAFH